MNTDFFLTVKEEVAGRSEPVSPDELLVLIEADEKSNEVNKAEISEEDNTCQPEAFWRNVTVRFIL